MFWKSNQDKPTTMSKAERVRVFSDFLRGEGYAPTTDSDGDIVYKCEGRVYLVILDEGDNEFFRIVYPGFWSIESPEERIRVERAALKACADTKVAKVFPIRDNTWATIEIFCANIEQAKAVFRRSMSALQTAVATFVEEMRK